MLIFMAYRRYRQQQDDIGLLGCHPEAAWAAEEPACRPGAQKSRFLARRGGLGMTIGEAAK